MSIRKSIIPGGIVVMIAIGLLAHSEASGSPFAPANPISHFMPWGIQHSRQFQGELPTYYYTPALSAQHACHQQSGWQWRTGEVDMCFHAGDLPCPPGHPWMRRATSNYTVCLSMNNPEWMSPTSSIH